MKKLVLLAVALLAWQSALADDKTRQEKIARIIEAQGLHQMFQQQLDQSKATAVDTGRNIIAKIMAESGAPDGEVDPEIEQIFSRHMERCAEMFTANELVSTWSSYYGKDLSEADLDRILAYYTSPTGKKDVLSSQKAMVGFSQAMSVSGQERLNAAISQLMAELRSVTDN